MTRLVQQESQKDESRYPILYIIMRTDLSSMNAGKGMAQACHGANQMVDLIKETFDTPSAVSQLLTLWEGDRGFGTTVILDGGKMHEIEEIINTIDMTKGDDNVVTGIVHDPSYPIRDGSATHLIPLDTCAFVFKDKNSNCDHLALDNLRLHR